MESPLWLLPMHWDREPVRGPEAAKRFGLRQSSGAFMYPSSEKRQRTGAVQNLAGFDGSWKASNRVRRCNCIPKLRQAILMAASGNHPVHSFRFCVARRWV